MISLKKICIGVTAIYCSNVFATEETELLEARTSEFQQEIIQVTDGVFTAVGYSVQPVSMIIGSDGIIIVDTGMDAASAEKVLADFRKITEKPVAGIILTHGHGDHTGGITAFANQASPQIWARSNYGEESEVIKSAGLTIDNLRGARQGGFTLPPEKRINNGIARAYYPARGGAVFGTAVGTKPTHSLSGARKSIEISDIQLDLVAITGETHDALYVWLPEKKVIFSGDNYYKSFPNLYPIRGAPYRDVQKWAQALDMMLAEEPEFLVPGHTRPVKGRAEVVEVLTDYRDAIQFVFDKTIEGMNQGLTPDQLVSYVKLPQQFKNKDHLRSYYGDPAWAVRAIFNAYLGWFDGNPSNLFPLTPEVEAYKVAEMAGGVDVLLSNAQQALINKEFQWASQLCDHLLAINPEAIEPKLIKADALEGVAEHVLSGIARNYYLTVAQELRQSVVD